MMNYDWHLNTRKDYMKRHDVYLAALAQRNLMKKEAEEKTSTEQRKADRENGFSTYVNGANQRSKSAVGPRTISRVSSGSSVKSPEPKKPHTAASTRGNRKSWAESLGQLPAFGDQADDHLDLTYSETFDDSQDIVEASVSMKLTKTSSEESIEERMSNASISSMIIPQLFPDRSSPQRKQWSLNGSIPFATIGVDYSSSPTVSVSTTSSPSPDFGIIEQVSSGDQLREKFVQKRNLLEESWNLIDNFERNNKGRASMIFPPQVLIEQDLEDVEESYETIIPELPRGQILDFIIHSTWGDRNYVGMNGLELWNHEGDIIPLRSVTSTDLKPNPKDPRSYLNKIVDGNYNTSDDMHSWVSEYTKARSKITFEFEKVQTLAMIRVWNYNRNRVHANRGVRYIELKLDRTMIFSDEIKSGQGDKSTPSNENILFTTDEQILNRIAQNDFVFRSLTS